MNRWIIKDTKFGYRYNTNKSNRKITLDYFNDYLYNLIKSKGSKDDELIIVGGIFNNTNPSIVSITDAVNCLSKISKLISIILIPNDKDIRKYDGEDFSTLNIFKNIPNIKIISDYSNTFIYLDKNNGIITIDNKIIPIPVSIGYEKEDDNIGILVIKDNGKYTILNNNFSPSHNTYTINDFIDFDDIIIDGNAIHLIINNKLTTENKTLLNISIFKVKPLSIKYFDDEIETLGTEINTNFNIIDNIISAIGEDTKLKEQFERILTIYKNK